MKAREARSWVAPAVFVAIGGLHIATIRDGQWLGSDASLYLVHARNLVEGIPYSETLLIVNPTKLDHSPAAYPPLVPLLLAPVYALRGLDLHAMKVELSVILVAAMAAVFVAMKPELGRWRSLAVAALFGIAPYTFSLKDDILSEFPFMLTCYSALALMRRTELAEGPEGDRSGIGVALGLLIYVAYATRTPGALLLPCFLLVGILRERRLTRTGAAAAAVFAGLAAVQHFIIPAQSSYFDVPFQSQWILWNLKGYSVALAAYWFSAFPSWAREPGFALFALLAAGGWLVRARRRWGVFEVFAPAYGAMILAWPGFAGARYALPLLPLALYYAFVGVEAAAAWAKPGRARLAPAAFTAFVFASPVSVLPRQSFDPLPQGYDRPNVVSVTRYLQRNTTNDAVLVSMMPRTWGLLARRKGSIYDSRLSDADQLAYFREIGVTHVVGHRVERADTMYLYPLLRRQGRCFRQVFSNGEFDVNQFIAPPSADPTVACGAGAQPR